MLQCREQLSSGVCGVGRLRLLGAVCVAGAGQGGQQLPAQLAACTGAGVWGCARVCARSPEPSGWFGVGTALLLPCCGPGGLC